MPLISQSGHPDITGAKLDELVHRIQFGGDEVVKAKDGAGSATLSMAMAGARFAESLLKASQGEKGVIEPTFVDSPLYKDQGCDFFASKVELGPEGVAKIYPVGKLTQHEEGLLQACLTGESVSNCPLDSMLITSQISRRTSKRVWRSPRRTHERCKEIIMMERRDPRVQKRVRIDSKTRLRSIAWRACYRRCSYPSYPDYFSN